MVVRTPVRIPVEVHASDPLSMDGAVSQLRRHSEVELFEEGAGRPGTVAVLLAEALDEPTLTRLRRLTRADGTKAVLVTRLIRAVLAASRGDGDLPSDLLGRLIAQVGTLQRGTTSMSGATASGLAPREVDVLRLVAEGMDTGEIASKLSYSERTVKNVMHGLTTRLQLRNRAHAVAYALREGYI